jgi:hypothetical protein
LAEHSSTESNTGAKIRNLTSSTRDQCSKVLQTLRTALSDTLAIHKMAKEKNIPTIESDIRFALTTMRQEISAALLSESEKDKSGDQHSFSTVSTPAVTETLLDNIFAKYSEQLLTKIDQHIQSKVDSRIQSLTTYDSSRHNSTSSIPHEHENDEETNEEEDEEEDEEEITSTSMMVDQTATKQPE